MHHPLGPPWARSLRDKSFFSLEEVRHAKNKMTKINSQIP